MEGIILSKFKYVIILCLFTFILPGNVYASIAFEVQGKNWSELANQVLTLVKQKEYYNARVVLNHLGNLFAKSNLADKNLTVDAIQQLSLAILDVKGHLNRLTPHDEEILMAVTKLVLAFDAVVHSEQPQWKGYYNQLLDKANGIQIAATKDKKGELLQKIKEFTNEYNVLRPALFIAKSPSIINQLDSLLRFMQTAKPQEVKDNLDELRELLRVIFQGSEKDVLAMFHPLKHLPIVIPIFWIMGFIVAILGIVSWRKHASFTQR